MKDELYISDLDGTLLDGKARLSSFSRNELNKMINQGLSFTVASARSLASMQRLLFGLDIKLPVIEFNGAFISDFSTGEHLQINSIDSGVIDEIILDLAGFGQVPLISGFDGKKDRLFFLEIRNEGEEWYINDRKEVKDPRLARAKNLEEALGTEVVCLTIIDKEEKLIDLTGELENKYSNDVEIHLFENPYSPGWHWLTIHDKKASKDQGIISLTKITGHSLEKLTVFGDNLNDLKMFALAPRAVAVENARDQIKEAANSFTGSNEEDGVVRYILENWTGNRR